MGKYGHSFVKTIIKPLYNRLVDAKYCYVISESFYSNKRMFQCASFTKWPITGTFTLYNDPCYIAFLNIPYIICNKNKCLLLGLSKLHS